MADPTVAVISEPAEFMQRLAEARASKRAVGFVPTMGALHAGHAALVHAARTEVGTRGIVAVSVFVNPTQFGPNEDYGRYPRQLDDDVKECARAGVNVVFAPNPDGMYSDGDQTRVRVGVLAEPLCGRFRAGHFEGVATVVTKLFAIAGECTAVFGRKDYQQLQIIRRVARDLFLPVRIVGVPTVREADGLALSSRNRYLATADRTRALAIPRALCRAIERWSAGERDVEAIRAEAERCVRASVDVVDYVDARDPVDLSLPRDGADRVLIAVAARLGSTRLIDNVVLGEDVAPSAALAE